VRIVELETIYGPEAHDDPDLTLVHANEAWIAAGGAEHAGEGVKVAIIDSGIDVTHPCFDDTGDPAKTQIGDPDLTNNNGIVAKVFGRPGVDGPTLTDRTTRLPDRETQRAESRTAG
jgi:subtilisin family serine protease